MYGHHHHHRMNDCSLIYFSKLVLFSIAVLSYRRNILDCDQSNYSSRIVFSHIPIEFGQTGISAVRSPDTENPTVEPNMKWIGRPLAEISPFEIFPSARSVGRRPPVGRQYIFLLTLISYAPLRYVRNVAKRSKNTSFQSWSVTCMLELRP